MTAGATGTERLRAPDFAAVRAEFALPVGFPPDVLAEAARAAVRAAHQDGDRFDATDVELVTIDPPGSKDLDQALGVRRRGDGFLVHYAIADLGAVVDPGGPLDREVRRRGQTVYLPDGSVPLHPPALSEEASSLLPDGPRPAVLWTFDLDASGERTGVDVRRATVRSRARLDYAGVQADVDAGRVHPAIAALPELGRLRRALAVARGAIELELPEQEVVPDGAGGWTTRIRQRVDVETWNAEMSLLTGTAAASIMLAAGVGLLRTLPAPEPSALAQLRRTAATLGIAWPEGATAAQVLSGLPRDTAPALALRRAASALLRGAGYAAFDRQAGTPAPADPGHGGSARPTRMSPRRCGGWWTGSAPRSASPSPPGRRCPGGWPLRCPPSRRSWGSPTPSRARWTGRASTAPRRRSWRRGSGRCSTPWFSVRRAPTTRVSTARCSSPNRRCWRGAPGCRGRGRSCGCGWSRRIRPRVGSCSARRTRTSAVATNVAGVIA